MSVLPSLQGQTATVFGGTGFIGRYIVARLAKAGAVVRVVTRHKQSAYFLRTNGVVGQVVPVSSTYQSAAEIERDVAGSDIVINCLGILHESKHSTFDHVHTEVPKWIAEACARHQVARFIHLSALGVDQAHSYYAKSKIAGEREVLSVYPTATILRPSVVFGAEDKFFNMFATMAKYAPVLPLIGGGKTRFQPVFVGDVADAVQAALAQPASQGRVYELGGPEVLSFKELMERMFKETKRPRPLMSVSWGLARIKASFLNILPNPPITNDQITSLQTDSVVGGGAATLQDLGIEATGLDSILPEYLNQYRPGGRFADKKRA